MKNKKGFSIAEILVILSIIALISLISLPLLANYQKTTKIRGEARLLATNLRLAQQLAITEQHIHQLKFFSEDNFYQIIDAETSTVIKEVTLDSEVSMNEISGFTDDTIQFTPTGGVMETGFVILINSRNEISTLEIKPSGYVEIND